MEYNVKNGRGQKENVKNMRNDEKIRELCGIADSVSST